MVKQTNWLKSKDENCLNKEPTKKERDLHFNSM